MDSTELADAVSACIRQVAYKEFSKTGNVLENHNLETQILILENALLILYSLGPVNKEDLQSKIENHRLGDYVDCGRESYSTGE